MQRICSSEENPEKGADRLEGHEQRAAELLADLDIHADVTQTIDNYSIAIQQMIAIARAVDMSAKVLILDEPTSSLDDSEVEKLFQLMRRLQSEGVGIIFVTHFLEQVYAVCDSITVLRNGQLVGQFTTQELPRVQLVAKMMGKDFDDLAAIKQDSAEKKTYGEEDIVIKAVGLGKKGYIKPFDLVIHKGEVVGFTGLLGSGRSETVRVIYGAEKPTRENSTSRERNCPPNIQSIPCTKAWHIFRRTGRTKESSQISPSGRI